jgi:acetylornithine/succinyldiaminopimelate/putrescine aminotransferase
MHLTTRHPRVLGVGKVLLGVVSVGGTRSRQDREDEGTVSEHVASTTEGDNLALFSGEVVLRVVGLSRTGDKNHIVFFTLRKGVVVEVVNSKEIARWKIDLEFAC